MRSVTRAEPSTIVTGFTNRHTTQVGAHAQHDKPLGSLNAGLVGLGVTKRLDVDSVGFFDFIGSTVADENGLSTPFDDEVLA